MITLSAFKDRGVAGGRRILTEFFGQAGPVTTALDLGCGGGGDLINLRRLSPDAVLFGLERSAPDDACKTEFLQKSINILQVNLEKDRLPFADESVDLVMSNQFLEHTRELFWIMHETSRVLKAGGHLIIGVPNLASLHNRLLLLFGRQPSSIRNASAHIRGFTRGDVLDLMNRPFPGGYVLMNFKGSGFYPFPARIADPLSGFFPSLAVRIFFLMQKARGYHREFIEYPVDRKMCTGFYLGEEN